LGGSTGSFLEERSKDRDLLGMDGERRFNSSGRGSRGEKNPAAKITSEDVEVIRSSPESLRVLALRFGLGKTQISRIKKGVSWNAASSGA
jgi:hypothetical protein